MSPWGPVSDLVGNNRVLTKGTSGEVQISLRTNSLSAASSNTRPIPLEPFSVNKDMGRVLIRRGGETIGAGQNKSFGPRQLFSADHILCFVQVSSSRL